MGSYVRCSGHAIIRNSLRSHSVASLVAERERSAASKHHPSSNDPEEAAVTGARRSRRARAALAALAALARIRAIAAIVVIAAGPLGCGDAAVGLEGLAVTPEGPSVTTVTRDTTALFQTDSLAYSLRLGGDWYQGEIGVTFTNRTSGKVYIVNCGGSTGLRLEKRVAGQWQGVWSPIMPACLSKPITVPAGATYRTRIAISAGVIGTNTAPQFASPDITGEYRAVWFEVLSSYQDQLPFGEPLSLAARVSNRFVLTAPQR